jgi:hypothetical protein
MDIYYKVSKDSGSTWGPETKLNTGVGGLASTFTLRHLYTAPRFSGLQFLAAWVVDGAQTDDLKVSAEMVEPHATYQLGV